MGAGKDGDVSFEARGPGDGQSTRVTAVLSGTGSHVGAATPLCVPHQPISLSRARAFSPRPASLFRWLRAVPA